MFVHYQQNHNSHKQPTPFPSPISTQTTRPNSHTENPRTTGTQILPSPSPSPSPRPLSPHHHPGSQNSNPLLPISPQIPRTEHAYPQHLPTSPQTKPQPGDPDSIRSAHAHPTHTYIHSPCSNPPNPRLCYPSHLDESLQGCVCRIPTYSFLYFPTVPCSTPPTQAGGGTYRSIFRPLTWKGKGTNPRAFDHRGRRKSLLLASTLR